MGLKTNWVAKCELGASDSGQAGPYEHGTEPLGSIKDEEFLD